MAEIVHQLIGSLSHYRVLYIQVVQDFFHQQSHFGHSALSQGFSSSIVANFDVSPAAAVAIAAVLQQELFNK